MPRCFTRNRRLVSLVLFFAALLVPAFAHAEPAIWVVKGPHATVYLFGTISRPSKRRPLALHQNQYRHSAEPDTLA